MMDCILHFLSKRALCPSRLPLVFFTCAFCLVIYQIAILQLIPHGGVMKLSRMLPLIIA